MKEQGLKAFMRAYRKGGTGFLWAFVEFLSHAGQNNYSELLTNYLRSVCQTNVEFYGLVQDMMDLLYKTPAAKVILIDSGVLGDLVQYTL